VQSHVQFSSFANADNNVLRKLPQRADRHTKSSPRHTLPGPPWHSASAGGPGPRISATNRCAGRRRPTAEKASKTTNSPSGSGTSSAPGTRPTPLPKYPSYCISCTRTEDIRNTPNSIVSLGRNSSPPRCPVYPRTMRRPAAYRQQKRKRTAWLHTVGGGGRSASRGPDPRCAGARRAGKRSNGFKRRLGFCGA
jgi:hypothetical protein